MVKYILFICMMLGSKALLAQDSVVQVPPDTAAPVHKAPVPVLVKKPMRRNPPKVVKADSVVLSDSLLKPERQIIPVVVSPSRFNDSFYLAAHPFYKFTDPVHYGITIKQWQGKEVTFYSMVALLLLFALIRNGFNRYINDLVTIFFRTTVNQRQTKEQLLQSPLPSLLLNIYYLLSVGMFLTLLIQYFRMAAGFSFWELFAYCVMGLMLIYGIKFISLKFLGWVFQVSEAIDSYIFIVFATNKVIGIAILPFLVVLAFSSGFINKAAMNISLLMVLGLFAYRFFLSYVSVHRLVRISFFHFVLYLCAFEVVPLLLINKLLFKFLGETY